MENERRVHWDPTINMGHVLSAGTSIVASVVFVISAYTSLDKRLVILEEHRAATQVQEFDRAAVQKEKLQDLKEAIIELKISVNELRRDMQQQPRKQP